MNYGVKVAKNVSNNIEFGGSLGAGVAYYINIYSIMYTLVCRYIYINIHLHTYMLKMDYT